MVRHILSILSHETHIAPGGYFHIQQDWFSSEDEIQSVIIDQSNVFSKILSIYPQNFYLYLEQDENGSIYRSNYPLIRPEGKDYFIVDWQK